MAFVLSKPTSYKWPVRIRLAIDGGKRHVETFDAEFRRLPQSRINEIVRQARAAERGRSDDDILEDQEVVRELMVGWDGVTDEAGKEIPFSESALGQLIEIPTVAAQIIGAWFESLKEAKRKN
jgi:hypothetical protein